jgi:hypothetical protein
MILYRDSGPVSKPCVPSKASARRVLYNEKAVKDKERCESADSNNAKICNGTETEDVHEGFKEARCQAAANRLVNGANV